MEVEIFLSLTIQYRQFCGIVSLVKHFQEERFQHSTLKTITIAWIRVSKSLITNDKQSQLYQACTTLSFTIFRNRNKKHVLYSVAGRKQS